MNADLILVQRRRRRRRCVLLCLAVVAALGIAAYASFGFSWWTLLWAVISTGCLVVMALAWWASDRSDRQVRDAVRKAVERSDRPANKDDAE